MLRTEMLRLLRGLRGCAESSKKEAEVVAEDDGHVAAEKDEEEGEAAAATPVQARAALPGIVVATGTKRG